ncbi:FmdB family zinc ribbon protein [Arthrobacter sp. H16F315]|uniref:FmdB family zinc ribbon protein n=1 Tax=Arthrobacter sp. H16F315 TaxID=2955314 RepID=UPI0020983D47|nr:zinc ribbon domain-containing protein [Arthrobacter sp. H16F315]MDD1477709.1 zinc ribbon domain-containing protein [Arthrobacter sp. H16F315]
MATYEYRCPSHEVLFESHHPIGEAPETAACPTCGGVSRRVISRPYLSQSGSAAFKLIDTTVRSAAEPQVVNSRIPGAPKRVQPYTSNPLHQKLPRP